MSEKTKKKRLPVTGHIEPQMNKYYLKVSRRYAAASFVLLLLLVAFIVYIATFYGDYVTYDNMKYLIRDLDAMSFEADDYQSRIVYNGGEGMSFSYFRGGISMCTKDSYRYFDTSGAVYIEDQLNYAYPVVVPSEKYLLIYDMGGTEYSVYNQLTRIMERHTSEKIIAGDIADDGSILLVTRSRETKYVVEMYNSTFGKSMSIYKENYVIDAAISPDGKLAVICSAVPSDTDFTCEVEIVKRGSSEAVATLNYAHSMPLEVYAAENGFVLLCDGSVRFMKYDGSEVGTVSLGGMNLKYADMNDSVIAIVGSLNALGSENRVMIYSMSEDFGTNLSDNVMKTRITGIYATANREGALSYITTPVSVVKIGSDGSETVHTPEDGEVVSVLPLVRGAMICQATAAYLTFEK